MSFGVVTEIDGDCHYAGLLLVNPEGRESNVVGDNLIVNPRNFEGACMEEAVLSTCQKMDVLDLTKKQAVFCKVPAFTIGEILVMDGNGRTVPDGRKPSKWFIKVEYFSDIDDAVKRAKKVTE